MLTLWSMVGPCLRSLFAWNYYYYYYYYYDHTIPLILYFPIKTVDFPVTLSVLSADFHVSFPQTPPTPLYGLFGPSLESSLLLPLARVNHGNVHSQIWRQSSHFKSHTSHLHLTIWPPALVYLSFVLIVSSGEWILNLESWIFILEWFWRIMWHWRLE